MKTAVITGAARGIGLATTCLMIEQGFQVAMVDRDAEELTKAAAELDQAKAFVDSPEYAPVKQMRLDNSAGTLVIVEGC